MFISGENSRPAFIIECIKEGYNTPFYTTPSNTSFKNNRSALDHAEFVHDAISELVSSNRVAQVAKSHHWVVNPLSVSLQSCGKKLLIFRFKVCQSAHIQTEV